MGYGDAGKPVRSREGIIETLEAPPKRPVLRIVEEGQPPKRTGPEVT